VSRECQLASGPTALGALGWSRGAVGKQRSGHRGGKFASWRGTRHSVTTLWHPMPTHTNSHEPIKVLDEKAHATPVAWSMIDWGSRCWLLLQHLVTRTACTQSARISVRAILHNHDSSASTGSCTSVTYCWHAAMGLSDWTELQSSRRSFGRRVPRGGNPAWELAQLMSRRVSMIMSDHHSVLSNPLSFSGALKSSNKFALNNDK
jgi:hypothetical protein